MEESVKVHLTVAGRIDDGNYHLCASIAKNLARDFKQATYELIPMIETDWETYVSVKRKELMINSKNKNVEKHTKSPLVFYNGINYIANLQSWSKIFFSEIDILPEELYAEVALAKYHHWMNKRNHAFVYMDIIIGNTEIEMPQRVVFELYTDVCPKTCENFRLLCTGGSKAKLSYKDSIFHRVVNSGWVQGGDIDGGRGDGGKSVYGNTFADESFAVKHDGPGILAMAAISNEPHSNNSQFYVTLAPQSWLDYKRVAFGRVISGMSVFRAIENVNKINERPVVSCTIVECGQLDASEDAKAIKEKHGSGLDLRRPKTKKRYLQLIFQTMDLKQEGSLTKDEIVNALERESELLETFFPSHYINLSGCFKYLEKDGDERISADEFIKQALEICEL